MFASTTPAFAHAFFHCVHIVMYFGGWPDPMWEYREEW